MNIIGRAHAYPVYLSIGNINKKARRAYSNNAYVLLAFLPILAGTGAEASHSSFVEAKRILYHKCLETILAKIKDAGTRYIRIIALEIYTSNLKSLALIYLLSRGCLMIGPDGYQRNCFPIITAFQVDYPEACRISLVRNNHACPVCTVRREDFDNLKITPELRTVDNMYKIYMEYNALDDAGQHQAAKSLIQKNGLVNLEVKFESRYVFDFCKHHITDLSINII